MTAVGAAAEQYLALRRSAGFKLDASARVLADFVAYLDRQGAGRLTTPLAVAWATQSGTPGQHARRLAVLRSFARYLQALDPATEVPPAGLLPLRRQRPTPYLYSDAEVAAIMAAAQRLEPALWAATCESLIGLLSATGMRVGEALRLDRSDVSTGEGVLTVWRSKFGKSRHVPLSRSTAVALEGYGDLRRRLCPRPVTSAFFVTTSGGRVGHGRLWQQFVVLLSAAGVPSRPGLPRPRMYDLRHSFVVHTILDWYQAGEDVQALLPRLSTVLGHANPASTYWYLNAAPELMALVAERLEPIQAGGSS